jgi:hypothetical protein
MDLSRGLKKVGDGLAAAWCEAQGRENIADLRAQMLAEQTVDTALPSAKPSVPNL